MKMTPFLQWLNQQLAAVNDFSDPEIAIVEGEENVIGEMSDELKRLYTVYSDTIEVAKTMVDGIKAKKDAGEKPDVEKLVELENLSGKLKLLKEVFWHEVRTESQTEEPSIGVRKDFKIVSMKSEGPEVTVHVIGGGFLPQGALAHLFRGGCPLHG